MSVLDRFWELPTLLIVTFAALGGFLAIAFVRFARAAWAMRRAIDVLAGESKQREAELDLVRGEYQLRINRMLARENYWRGMAQRNMEPEPPEPEAPPEESALAARQRMRGY